MIFPSASQPCYTTFATVSFCSFFSAFSWLITSNWSLLFTLTPSSISVCLILNFSKVLKKRRAVLSNPSTRSVEWCYPSRFFVCLKCVPSSMRWVAKDWIAVDLLLLLSFLASIHICSVFLKSSVSFTLF